MDATQFDVMTKVLSSGANRRSFLARLVGGGLAGVFGWQKADAKSKKKRHDARKGRPQKKRRKVRAQERPACIPGGHCERTADCCPTETCVTDPITGAGLCMPTAGSGSASCVATGCPLSTNPCQEIVCDQQSGNCISQNLPEETPCNDNNLCTGPDLCRRGQCGGESVICPESPDPCKVASCDPATGCGFTNRPNGTHCGAPSGCAQPTCQEGVCVPGTATCPVCKGCAGGTCRSITGGTDSRCPDSIALLPTGGQICCGGTCCRTRFSVRTGQQPTEMCCATVANPTSPDQFQCLPLAPICPGGFIRIP